MNARAKQLAEIGLREFNAPVPGRTPDDALIYALAAMLAAPAAKKVKPEGPPLPFSPQAVHQALVSRVPHLVTCDLVNGQLFGFLGKKLKGISGLETADLERLVSWIEAGGFSGLQGVQPTFQMVVHNIDKYFSWAREWERRGRPTIRRGGPNVGKNVTNATGDVGALFKQ